MKKILGLITVLLLLAAPAFSADNLGDIYKRALKAYNLKHYAKAAELFTVYVKYHPEAEAYYRIGYSLYKLGKDEEANKYFDYAYAIDPDFTPGPYEKRVRSSAPPVSMAPPAPAKAAAPAKTVAPVPTAPVKTAAPAPATAKTAVPAASVKAAASAPATAKTAVPAAPVKAAAPAVATAKTAVPAAPVKAAPPTTAKTAVPAAPVKAAAPAVATAKTAVPAAPVKAAAPAVANAAAQVNAPVATPQLAPKKPAAPAPKPPVTVPEESGMAGLGTNMILAILGAIAVFYLILSYFLFRLARKLNVPSPWMTWLPVIQLFVVLMGYRAYKKASSMTPFGDDNAGADSSGLPNLDDFKFTDEPPASDNEPSDFNTSPDFDLPAPQEPESDDFSYPGDSKPSSSGDFETAKPESDEFSFNDDSTPTSKDEFESTQSMNSNDFNFNLKDNATDSPDDFSFSTPDDPASSSDDFSFTATDNSEGFPTDFSLSESEDDDKKK